MKEKDFQTLFINHFKASAGPGDRFRTSAFELKIEKGGSMRFDRLAQHQKEALLKVKHDFLIYKIPDQPVSMMKQGQKTRFTLKKPFDCFLLDQTGAYVVIWFYQPRTPKQILFIDIDAYIKAEEDCKACGRASMKREEWAAIATCLLEMKK